MIRKSLVALALCLALPVSAMAQAEKNDLFKGGFQYNDMGATPPKDDSLYRALGGKEKIAAFTTEFVGLIAKDDRIGHFFVDIDLDHLGQMLTDQFIELSGGPVAYAGRDMAEVHRSLGIANADFNRLAEDLQAAMDHHDVPFATQNRLVALLASMQRAVVTK
ncbi:MAG: group I truncated hemoglobin [Stellaceae bacterium]